MSVIFPLSYFSTVFIFPAEFYRDIGITVSTFYKCYFFFTVYLLVNIVNNTRCLPISHT